MKKTKLAAYMNIYDYGNMTPTGFSYGGPGF